MSLTLWFCLHKLTVDYEYFLVLLMLNSYVVSEIVTRGALDMQLGSWFLYSFIYVVKFCKIICLGKVREKRKENDIKNLLNSVIYLCQRKTTKMKFHYNLNITIIT